MSSFASTLRYFAHALLTRVLRRSLAEGCLRHQQGDGVLIWSEEVLGTLRQLDAKPLDLETDEHGALELRLW
ncbi:MAG: hypothetical protein RBU37_27330, partial [Myxococcota bacterium]|nr:hypothetical protein [Myxococcota bacterium]